MPYYVIRVTHPNGKVEYFVELDADSHASEKWLDADLAEATRFVDDDIEVFVEDIIESLREIFPGAQVQLLELDASGKVIEIEDYL